MVATVQMVEEELRHSSDPLMTALQPRFAVIGSIPEGTRIHSANELDITMTFKGLNAEQAFSVNDSAMEVFVDPNERDRHPLKRFISSDTCLFDFPAFLQWFLSVLSVGLQNIRRKLPQGMWLANGDSFCRQCIRQKEALDPNSIYTPYTHCQKCLFAVTHTRVGACLILRRHVRVPLSMETITIDIVPIFPVKASSTLELFQNVSRTLLEKRPPFWVKYFNGLVKKDGILPEQFGNNMSDIEDGIAYVSMKLLHYGTADNFIIRPAQRMRIQQFRNKTLRIAYCKLKLMRGLFSADIKSYVFKKILLSPTFEVLHEDDMSRGLIGMVLVHPEVSPAFADYLDFSHHNKWHGPLIPLTDAGVDYLKNQRKVKVKFVPSNQNALRRK